MKPYSGASTAADYHKSYEHENSNEGMSSGESGGVGCNVGGLTLTPQKTGCAYWKVRQNGVFKKDQGEKQYTDFLVVHDWNTDALSLKSFKHIQQKTFLMPMRPLFTSGAFQIKGIK